MYIIGKDQIYWFRLEEQAGKRAWFKLFLPI